MEKLFLGFRSSRQQEEQRGATRCAAAAWKGPDKLKGQCREKLFLGFRSSRQQEEQRGATRCAAAAWKGPDKLKGQCREKLVLGFRNSRQQEEQRGATRCAAAAWKGLVRLKGQWHGMLNSLTWSSTRQITETVSREVVLRFGALGNRKSGGGRGYLMCGAASKQDHTDKSKRDRTLFAWRSYCSSSAPAKDSFLNLKTGSSIVIFSSSWQNKIGNMKRRSSNVVFIPN